MAKKVVITEGQKTLLSRLIEPVEKPSFDPYIPLSDENIARKLLQKGIKQSTEDFKDDITAIPSEKLFNRITKLMNECVDKERHIRPQLEQACYNTLVYLFDIPQDTVEIELELVDQIDPSHKFHFSPDSTVNDDEYESVSKMDDEQKDYEKRFLTNMMIEGISESLTMRSRKEWISEVSDLDEELPLLYSRLIKINRYAVYTVDSDDMDEKNNMQGGYVETTIGNGSNPVSIKVKAMCFPILLHEAIKGLMEIAASESLPKDIKSAKKVIDHCDVLKQEPWNMRFGLQLWNMVTGGKDIETTLIPELVDQITSLQSDVFISLMKEVLNGTREGREAIDNLLGDVKKEHDYQDFEDDLLKKRKEKLVIDEVEFDI